MGCVRGVFTDITARGLVRTIAGDLGSTPGEQALSPHVSVPLPDVRGGPYAPSSPPPRSRGRHRRHRQRQPSVRAQGPRRARRTGRRRRRGPGQTRRLPGTRGRRGRRVHLHGRDAGRRPPRPGPHRHPAVAAPGADGGRPQGGCLGAVREAADPVARRVRRDRGGRGGVRGLRLRGLPAPLRVRRRPRARADHERRAGRPRVAHCQTTWHRDAAYYAVPWRGTWASEGGGPTMGHGIHQYDLLLHLLGPWAEIRAMAARLVHDTESEDVSTALVRFENGALATVVNSVLSPDEVSRIRIDCADATVELTHLYGHRNQDWTYTPAPHVAADRVDAWRTPAADVPSSHAAQLGALLDAYDNGVRPPGSGADARATLEFAAALYKSAFTGGPYTPARSRRATPSTRPCTATTPTGPPRSAHEHPRQPRPRRAHRRRGGERHGDPPLRLPTRPRGLRGQEALRPPGAHPRRPHGDRLPSQRPPLAQGSADDREPSVGAELLGRQLLCPRAGLSAPAGACRVDAARRFPGAVGRGRPAHRRRGAHLGGERRNRVGARSPRHHRPLGRRGGRLLGAGLVDPPHQHARRAAGLRFPHHRGP